MLRYSIVVPVRDEQAHIGRLLDALLSQRVLPQSVHIVDDGSSDRTPEILKGYVARLPLITVTTMPIRTNRNAGGESAVRTAFATVDWERTEILGRLDADVSFGSDYFELLLDKFDKDPKLGIASGLIYEPEGDKWIPQSVPSYHTRGASKLYRRECYERIQPIGTCLGWDGQDEARANCYGWRTRTYEDAAIYHHRRVGTGVGAARFWRNLGVSAYYIGYHPAFLFVRAITKLHHRPMLVGAMMMLYGMIEGYVKKLPREDRPEVISFVRHQQINRLLGRETIWK